MQPFRRNGSLLSIFVGAFAPLHAQLAPSPQDYVAAIGASPPRAPVTADFSPGASFTIESWIHLSIPTANGGWIAGKSFGAPGVDPLVSFSLQINANQRVDFSYSTGAPGSYRGITSDVAIAPRT